MLAADGLDEAVLRPRSPRTTPMRRTRRSRNLRRRTSGSTPRARKPFSALRDLERQLGSLEDGVGAELALQQRRNAEAEIILEARNWAVLASARSMIGEAIERQRADRQEPLMARAGALSRP